MKTIILGTVAVAALAAGSAQAHHSGAMYDAQKTITLNGVTRELQWTNPHSWLQVDVP